MQTGDKEFAGIFFCVLIVPILFEDSQIIVREISGITAMFLGSRKRRYGRKAKECTHERWINVNGAHVKHEGESRRRRRGDASLAGRVQACDIENREATDELMTDGNDDYFDEEAEREEAEWGKIAK